jgi:hypothetical protein
MNKINKIILMYENRKHFNILNNLHYTNLIEYKSCVTKYKIKKINTLRFRQVYIFNTYLDY